MLQPTFRRDHLPELIIQCPLRHRHHPLRDSWRPSDLNSSPSPQRRDLVHTQSVISLPNQPLKQTRHSPERVLISRRVILPISLCQLVGGGFFFPELQYLSSMVRGNLIPHEYPPYTGLSDWRKSDEKCREGGKGSRPNNTTFPLNIFSLAHSVYLPLYLYKEFINTNLIIDDKMNIKIIKNYKT